MHELSDPEFKEFVEFVHTSYEIGVEERVEHLITTMHPENMDMFKKFVQLVSAQPHYFDLNHIGHLLTNAS